MMKFATVPTDVTVVAELGSDMSVGGKPGTGANRYTSCYFGPM